ncbi:uroporphyrinogen-III C-methyltransferase [Pseudocolwellia sp. HL-MZ7]|uniref:uroporphyrinogen-III C-methyltransferase n=1 Tax=Pseudocolwellia sp. HL-MZ7 TaxID=3400627 RepID=UPI003CFB9545
MMTDKPTTKNSDNSAEKGNSITKSTQKSAESSSTNSSQASVSVNMSNSTNAIKDNAAESKTDNNKNLDEKSKAAKSNDKAAQKTETAKPSVSPQSSSSQKVKQTMKPEQKKDSKPEIKKAVKQEEVKEPEKKSKISKLAVLSLLIALLAIVGVVLLYFWHVQQQNTIISQLQQVKSEATKGNQLAQQRMQEKLLRTLQDQEQKLAMQFSNSANNMKQETQDNIEQLNLMVEKFSQNQPTDWLVHEAEYLVRVAARTLWLEKDTTAAIGLLQDADTRIAELNDPEILPIRQLIYQDIEALRLMPKLETEQVILSLMALGEQVQSLPLVALTVAKETENADRYTLSEDVSDWRENMAKTWDKLLQTFVVVHSRVGDLEPILPADQRQHLKENLSLKLQVAQWAASKGNHTLFVKSLNDAQLWLTQYFDLNDEKNKVFINSIESVKNKVIVVEDELKLVSLKAIRKALEDKKSTRPPAKPIENKAPLEENKEEPQAAEESQSIVIPEANSEVIPEVMPEITPEIIKEELSEQAPEIKEAEIKKLSDKVADKSEAA